MFSVNLIQMFRFDVIRLEVLIAKRQCGRNAAIVTDFSKILLAKSQQCRAVNLRVPADVILNARVKGLSILVVPRLLGLVFGFEKDRTGVPVILLSWQVSAPVQKQNAFARWSKMVGEGPATGARADDDDVKMILLRHLQSFFLPISIITYGPTSTIWSQLSQELLSGQKKVNRIGARCAAVIGMSTNSTPKLLVADRVSLTVCHSSFVQ